MYDLCFLMIKERSFFFSHLSYFSPPLSLVVSLLLLLLLLFSLSFTRVISYFALSSCQGTTDTTQTTGFPLPLTQARDVERCATVF